MTFLSSVRRAWDCWDAFLAISIIQQVSQFSGLRVLRMDLKQIQLRPTQFPNHRQAFGSSLPKLKDKQVMPHTGVSIIAAILKMPIKYIILPSPNIGNIVQILIIKVMGNECSSICEKQVDDKSRNSLTAQPANPEQQNLLNFSTHRKISNTYLFNPSSSLFSSVNASKPIEKTKTDKGIYHLIFPQKVQYYGDIDSDDQQHGYGIQKWADGASYAGDWKHGKLSGKGKFIHASGDFYEGQWEQSEANGKGIFKRVHGGFYEGQWKKDEPHGYGTEQWGDGNLYQGQYSSGLKDGKGAFKWSDGSQFEGQWKKGKIEGFGTYKHYDGRVYEGNWKDNMMHGGGVYKWKDGRKYVGEYENDKKNGYGKYYWNDGRIFQGEWKNGKRCGRGRILYPNGTVKAGLWENDKRIDDHGSRSPTKTVSPTKLVEKSLNYIKQKQNKTYSDIHASISPRKR